MKIIKKALRLLVMVLFMILASFGLGITGVMFGNRERYLNNEVKREQIDKSEEEEAEIKK
ncbi:MAG: hypothetical protein ABJH04_10265 [Cyclobacteriaceae bacterium]